MKTNNDTQAYRILVIDDNISIHEDFQKIFETPSSAGNDFMALESVLFETEIQPSTSVQFKIDCASQGREGLELALQAKAHGHPFAVAFVDGRMPPGWDGVETINHLWAECPDLQVVLCTAYADYSWQEIKQVLGGNDNLLILKKPFENMEVLQLAHALTRKWKLNREVHKRIENLDDLVRKRTQEKDCTRALLEAALEHSPAGIVISNANGTEILWANRSAVEIYRHNPGDFASADNTNEPCAYFQASWADGTLGNREDLALLRAALDGETIHDEEVLLHNAKGRDKWIAYNAAPIRDANGKIIAGIIIFHDISERKHAQKEHEKLQAQLFQAQKMESVGLLSGGIAHDFNNMMAVILGTIELALEKTSPAQSNYETLKIIQKAAKRSSDLTQQLLTFARKQIVNPQVLNINEKIADSLEILQRVLGENISIVLKPDSDLWPVHIDPSQVDQIILNLGLNARDAIAGVGELSIETKNFKPTKEDLSIHPWLRSGDYVRLTVKDNGCGINREYLDRVFEPFFTTKAKSMGTGLGLATVYGIVKQNRGFIGVDSQPGGGSTFTIYLPRSQRNISKPAVADPKEHQKGLGETVLIVEDEVDILTLSKKIVEKLGYSALVANTPNEALRVAEANPGKIQLLLTDVIMPEMNGWDLSNQLLSIQPDLKCLFVSGYSEDIIAQHGLMDKGVHFLQKPYAIAALSKKIKEALDAD